MRRRPVALAAAVIVLLVGALIVTVALSGRRPKPPPPVAAPPSAPVTSIDLSSWKLTLPTENQDGGIAQIQPAAPTPPWMSRNPDGSLEFWAPSVGATTKHSDHPRTELNSLTNFTTGQGVHTLKATVTLLQEPADGQGVILGQIHGAGDMSSVPYVMLRYQNHGVIVVVKQVQDGNDHINYQLLDNVPLNSTFTYAITDQGNGNLLFSATMGARSLQTVAPIPPEFRNATVRFQAGDYQQADDGQGPQDGGRVIFHGLEQGSTAP
jgi:hypothetical protein